MARIIILDGPSRTGKSTITDYLCNTFGWKHVQIEERRPKGYDLRSFYKGIWDATVSVLNQFNDETFVMDRFIFTELAYAKVLNREPCITRDDVLGVLINHEVKVFYLTNTYDEYRQRSPKEGYTRKQHDDLLKAFEDLFFEFNVEPIRIATSGVGIDQIRERIEDELVASE
jgi:thymidylate kinase